MTMNHCGDLLLAFLLIFFGRVKIRVATDAVRVMILYKCTRVCLQLELIISAVSGVHFECTNSYENLFGGCSRSLIQIASLVRVRPVHIKKN
jgi:hypothetical protein